MIGSQSMEYFLVPTKDERIRLDIFYYQETQQYEVIGSIKNSSGIILKGSNKYEVINKALSELKNSL